MKKQVITMLIALVSFGAYAQHDHGGHSDKNQEQTAGPVFKDEKLGGAYGHYLHLKDALVASNGDEAKQAASELQKALLPISNGKKAANEATKTSSSSDLTEQRKSFSLLSKEMTTLVKGSKLSSGYLFVEYCPMANNNDGAFWLSNEREIKNPYFGNMMLKCGSVKETLQ